MDITQMCKALNITKVPQCFFTIYAQIQNTYEAHVAQILSDEFIADTLEKNRVMLAHKQAILTAARQARQTPALCLLVCLLEKWVLDGGNVADPEYEEPTGSEVLYDFLHLLPAIPTITASAAHLRNRGVPEDVIDQTLGEYDFCVQLCADKLGRPAFLRDRLHWISRLIHNKMLRVDRLKYDLPGNYLTGVRVYKNRAGEMVLLADDLQIHSSGRILESAGCTDPEGSFHATIWETQDEISGYPVIDGMVENRIVSLPKAQWELFLCKDDPVLRIHIPSDGSFDKQTIEQTYRRTREIMARCYPDQPFKAFCCRSWLMSLELRQILKPDSNILAFQKPFTYVPSLGKGRLVFSFVFGVSGVTPDDFSTLPENTSLQRAIKQHYLNGGFIHEDTGFFSLEELADG